MTVPTDPYVFVNGTPADGVQVNARYAPLYAALNGALDTDNLLDVINERLGLTKGAIKRRGKSIIPAAESRTNAAYGTMPTPDQVAGIVLPTDGLIYVAYQATWQNSVAAAGRAAIFIGANQLKWSLSGGTPVVQDQTGPSATATDNLLATSTMGLNSYGAAGAYGGDVTTGQIIGIVAPANVTDVGGGATYIFAAAGTYDVSVQFKSASGSVTAKNRKLWVWTIGF